MPIESAKEFFDRPHGDPPSHIAMIEDLKKRDKLQRQAILNSLVDMLTSFRDAT